MKILGNFFDRPLKNGAATQTQDGNIVESSKYDSKKKPENNIRSGLSQSLSNSIIGKSTAGVQGQGIKGLAGEMKVTQEQINDISDRESEQIEAFYKDDFAPESEKLEAIRAAIKKDIPITEDNLRSVRSAMFGDGDKSSVVDAAPTDMDGNLVESGGESSTADMKLIVEAIKNLLGNSDIKSGNVINMGEVGKIALVKLESGTFAVKADLVQDIKKLVLDMLAKNGLSLLNGATLEDAFANIEASAKDSGVEDSGLKNIISDIRDQVTGIIKGKGTPLAEESRGSTHEDEDLGLNDGDFNVEAAVDNILSSIAGTLSHVSDGMSDNKAFRQIIRIEVTQAMVSAKEEFKSLKLDTKAEFQKIDAKTSREDISSRLGKIIDKLDKFIMKSDALLYTSMKIEKSLLEASSTLQEARKALELGKVADCKKIISGVATLVNEIDFKPSSRRVELFVSKSAARYLESSTPEVAQKHVNNLTALKNTEKSSARVMLELMRSLGFNNEFETSEIFERSADRGDVKEKLNKELVNDNLKSVLVKIMNDDDFKDSTQTVQRSLDTIMGTQLMNKEEHGKNDQTMMFVIPMQKSESDARVMINSRRKNGAIDDENCSLYFSFETEKLGITGIKMNIKNNTVGFNIYNDNFQSREVLKLGFEGVVESISELGLKKGSFTVSTFNERTGAVDEKQTAVVMEPAVDQGRFDFKL